MVNYQASSLDQTFAALADPTRRAILSRLRSGRSATTDLARPFRMSLPAILKHLRVLEKAGLVQGEKRGRERFYELRADRLGHAGAWLETYREFWDQQLDALDQFLKESK